MIVGYIGLENFQLNFFFFLFNFFLLFYSFNKDIGSTNTLLYVYLYLFFLLLYKAGTYNKFLFLNSANKECPNLAGDFSTTTPADSKAAILDLASPLPPATIAPA